MRLPTHEELLAECINGASHAELAEKYGVSLGTIHGRIRTARVREGLKLTTPPAPQLFDVPMPAPLELAGDFVIVSDVHVPTTDYHFAAYPMAIAQAYLDAPRRMIIAGDLFNMDEFSKYEKIARTTPWKQERDAARQLFHEWLEVFDEIYFIMGNHDRRIEKWTNGNLDSEDLISLIVSNPEKVKHSEYGWCTVTSGGVKWRVTHPKNYSIVAGNVLDQLAQKYQTNIIGAHEHHFGVTMDRYKHYTIVNNGGLFAVDKMSYVVMDDSKSAGMAQGFTLLKNGRPYLFGDEQFTDYSFWL